MIIIINTSLKKVYRHIIQKILYIFMHILQKMIFTTLILVKIYPFDIM